MLREPGYPFFRALIKTISQEPLLILILQAVLFAVSVLLIGNSFGKLEGNLGTVSAWAAALCYGAAFYAARNLFEILALFQLSIIVYLFMRWMDDLRHWYQPIVLGLFCGALLLTRFSFVLLPLALSVALTVRRWQLDRKIISALGAGALCLVTTSVILFPWMLRNYQEFGVFNIASRSGTVLYARGLKAEESWGRYSASLGSIVLGRALLAEVVPNANPIYRDYWVKTWAYFDKLGASGLTFEKVDVIMGQDGRSMIFKNPENLARYLAWSGLDLMRLLAWPSPSSLGSDIEYTFAPQAVERGGLTIAQNIYLVALHVLQLVWWVLLTWSIIFGFRKYGWRYMPGIIILAYVLPHAFTDNIVRYSIPILPLAWGSVAVLVFFLMQRTGVFKKLKFYAGRKT